MMFDDAKAVSIVPAESGPLVWQLTGEQAITDKNDIRYWACILWKQSKSMNELDSFEEFQIKNGLSDEAHWRSTYAELCNILFMYMMKDAGQWELSWDMFPTNDALDLYPIQLTVVNAEDCNSFPALLAELKIFKSGKEAKRNGWAKPITKGDHFFKKKTYILRII